MKITLEINSEVETDVVGAIVMLRSYLDDRRTAANYEPPVESAPTPVVPEVANYESAPETPDYVAKINAALGNGAPLIARPEFDTRGLPWDSRIHSDSKTLNADGTWRRRRNCDPDLIASVEEELVAKVRDAEVAVTSEEMYRQDPEPAPAAPAPEPAPAAPAPEPAPAAPAKPRPTVRDGSLPDLIVYVSHRIGEGSLTLDTLRPCYPEGVVNLPDLKNCPEKIRGVYEALELV